MAGGVGRAEPSDTPWPAVDAFLVFALRPQPSTRAEWPELAQRLDALVLARWACPAADHPEGGDLAPRAQDEELRPVLAARFPEFGYYRTVEPVFGDGDDPREPASLGDAIDDLIDMTKELQHAMWYREHRGAAVGAALLAWSFDMHWGWHARGLQLYLHSMMRT